MLRYCWRQVSNTVNEDGGVPVHFQVRSGNVSDDQAHQASRDLVCQLVGR